MFFLHLLCAHPHRYAIVTLILFFSFCSGFVRAESDFSIEHREEFHVSEDGDGFSLTSSTLHTATYLTERSLSYRRYYVPEPFFTTIDDLEGHVNGKGVDDDGISYFFPEHQDLFISGLKVWTVSYPELVVGDRIDYSYSSEYDGAEWFPIIRIDNEGTDVHEVSIEHPSNVNVTFEFYFPRDTVPYVVKRPDGEHTVLRFEDLEYSKPIDYFPFSSLHAAVQVRLTRDGETITPTRPNEFVAWYRSLNDGPVGLSQAAKEEITSVVASAGSSKRDRLEALYDFVRQEIRYIADEDDYGAIVPRPPGTVLERGYGDCKDKAQLIREAARHFHIDVDLVLVSTSPTVRFENGVYVSQFDHVICSWVDDHGDRLYFDPTARYTEFGNLPYGDIQKHALILNEDNPQSLVIPKPKRGPSIDIEVRGALDEPDQSVARVTLRNGYYSSAIHGLEELGGLDLENMLSQMLTSQFNKLSLDYFEPDSVGNDFVTFVAVADLSDFIIASPTRRYLPAMPFRSVDPDILERKDDTHPLVTDLTGTIRLRLMLDVGPHTIKEKSFDLGDDAEAFMTSSLRMSEPGTALFDYEMRQSARLYEKDAKQRYLHFCSQLLDSKNEMFILTSPTK